MVALLLAAATTACAPSIVGGNPAEQAAVARMVCRMPDNRIAGVQLVSAQRVRGTRGPLGIRILLPPAGNRTDGDRGLWEADVAGRSIAAGFQRLGLPRVGAYAAATVGTPAGPLDAANEVVVTPRPLPPPPRRGETWAQIEARFDALDRRFHVRSHLDRVNAFAKTPAVTVVVPDPARFLGGPAVGAYLKALHWNSHSYPAAYLGVAWQRNLVWSAETGTIGGGCGYQITAGAGRTAAAVRACRLAGVRIP
jgi:hypothetical protein